MSQLKQLSAMSAKINANITKSATIGAGNKSGKPDRNDFAKVQNDAIKSLSKRISFEGRMTRQRVAGERALAVEQSRTSRAAESDVVRLFRVRMRSTRDAARMNAMVEREAERSRARTVAAEERSHATAIRRQISGHRYLFSMRERMDREERRSGERQASADDRRRAGLRRDAGSRGRDAMDYGRDAYRGVTRAPAVAAVAGIAGTASIAKRALTVEQGVDAAEINTRIYGGLSKDAARQLRDGWAAPLAESLGSSTEKLLNSYTEALKTGIPNEGAKAFSALATQTSEVWSVPFEKVVDSFGLVNTLLTSDGSAFDGDRIKSVANSLQHLAAKQATTPEKLLSFMARGAGASQILGMSQEAGLAFGSASTSLGNQAGQSGRMMDYTASRIVEMPRLTKKKGDEGRQARDLMQSLGYGTAENMDRQRRADPDAFLPDFVERFKKIQNPKKQEQAIRFFTGREWFGEFGRMVKGFDTYKEADRLRKEAKGLDAIGGVWDLHKLKLKFVFQQFKAGFSNILGEAGKVLSPLARQVGDYFLGWTEKLRNGGLADRVKASIEGFIEGLGFKDLPDLLKGIFGEPGQGDAGSVDKWRDTAREFSAGIRDVIGGITSVIKAFSGGDPGAVARWTGRILTATVVLMMLAPVAGVLGGLASAVMALGFAGAAAWKLLKLAGVVGTAGKVAGAAAGAAGTAGAGAAGAAAGAAAKGGKLALLGRALGVVGLADLAQEFGVLKAPTTEKSTGRNILDALDPGLASRVYGDDKRTTDTPKKDGDQKDVKPRVWIDPPAKKVDGPKSIPEQIQEKLPISKTSYTGNSGDLSESMDRLRESVDKLTVGWEGVGSRLKLDAITKPATVTKASFSTGSESSTVAASTRAFDPARQFGKNFFTPDAKVPSWYGKGGSNGNKPDPGTGAGVGPYKPILDHIAKSEGTAGRGDYNASFGYGKFLPGGKETNLTGKTLDEVLALGDHMRRQPGNPNSSALGRYQIVGQTMRGLMRKFSLSGKEKFDEAMQDRMGAELVRQRGASASGLGNEWASLRGQKLATAVDLAGKVGQTPTESVVANLNGLRVKGSQATGGGGHVEALTTLAKDLQDNGIAGGFKQVTAFNDHFHQGRRSKHNEGLASDVTINDPSQSAVAAEQIRNRLRAAGLPDSAFKVIDEYRNPSGHSTGGHLHTQFNSKEAAAQFKTFAEKATAAITPKIAGTKENPVPVDGPAGGKPAVNNWHKVPDAQPNRSEAMTSGVPARRTPEQMIERVPEGQRSVGMQRASMGVGGGNTTNITQNIHGGVNNPQQIANLAQRKITEDWNHRSHDLEPELS
ncbi:phage tail tape measure protein [Methylobacterium sp. 10]|uniref:phage tail tape measure protein n=1 Tax=Methylobacterium sp. 10 TaxID=1101191 RepID=UPI00048945BF|nr:phage tail tape measure protein [Methylobacterium sp. 10]